MVSLGDAQNFVMADIPGLIEGASEGVGLGHDFLRHIERTKVIIHVLDASGIEGRDPVEDFYKINKELSLYSPKLAKRSQVIAANKLDLPQASENLARIQEMAEKEGLKVFPVSAATKEGLQDLMRYVYQMLQDYVEEVDEEDNAEKIYNAQEDDADDITIKRDMTGQGFIVSGKSLEKLVAMTNFGNDEAIRRFQYIWRLKGIDEKLRAKGIKEGDTVYIGEMEFEYRQ